MVNNLNYDRMDENGPQSTQINNQKIFGITNEVQDMSPEKLRATKCKMLSEITTPFLKSLKIDGEKAFEIDLAAGS